MLSIQEPVRVGARQQAGREQVDLTGLTIVLLGVAFVHFRETSPEAPIRRFAFTPDSLAGSAAISPNGRHIAYAAGGEQRKLWVRDLDHEQPRELDGTEGARDPFWSPDSQVIGFATTRELKKISVQGGPTITLCLLPHPTFIGGTWNSDGNSIAFSSEAPGRIYEVPVRGGKPQLLFERERSEKGVDAAANAAPE